MTDEDETVDAGRGPSKRDRLKGVLGRTKTRFRRKDNDQADEEVEDFLSAGRNSTSTGRPSISDSLTFADSSPPPDRPPTSDAPTNIRSTQLPYPDTFVPPPQQSPRRIVVPRIDVSRSQRYPGSQAVGQQQDNSINTFLQPQYAGRSQSVSSLSKGRGRARGLSVTFAEAPPVVIGEGGDEAHAPTIEVSKARGRARSVSPTRTPRSTVPVGRLWSRSPLKRKPVPDSMVSPVTEELGFVSPGLRRVPTSFSPASDDRPLDREFEMSFGVGSASTNSAGSSASPAAPYLHAPKPVRPPVAIPPVRNLPALHELKPSHAKEDLRSQFESEESENANPFADPAPPAPAPNRFYAKHAPGLTLPIRQFPEPRGRTGYPESETDGRAGEEMQ